MKGKAVNFVRAGIILKLILAIVVLSLCFCGAKPSQENYAEYKNKLIRYADEDNCEKVLEIGRDLLDINVKDDEVYRLIAGCFARSGRIDSAVFYYQGAIVFNPADREAYELVGDLYFENDDYHDAMTWYDRALQINYVSSKSYMRLAIIHQNWHEYTQAKTYYEYALIADSANYEALYGLGTVELALKDFNSAIITLSKAADNGHHAEAAFELGNLYQRKGEYDEAISWLDKCIEFTNDQLLKDKAYQLKMEIVIKQKAGK